MLDYFFKATSVAQICQSFYVNILHNNLENFFKVQRQEKFEMPKARRFIRRIITVSPDVYLWG
jgi:hypothetical protein